MREKMSSSLLYSATFMFKHLLILICWLFSANVFRFQQAIISKSHIEEETIEGMSLTYIRVLYVPNQCSLAKNVYALMGTRLPNLKGLYRSAYGGITSDRG